MLRMIKLAAYGALGYLLYEIYQGWQQGSGGQRVRDREFEKDMMKDDEGRMGRLTGSSGRGETISTSEPSGASTSQVVGRGVIAP